MKLSELEPSVQSTILILATDYAKAERDRLDKSRRHPNDEKKWLTDTLRIAVQSMLAQFD